MYKKNSFISEYFPSFLNFFGFLYRNLWAIIRTVLLILLILDFAYLIYIVMALTFDEYFRLFIFSYRTVPIIFSRESIASVFFILFLVSPAIIMFLSFLFLEMRENFHFKKLLKFLIGIIAILIFDFKSLDFNSNFHVVPLSITDGLASVFFILFLISPSLVVFTSFLLLQKKENLQVKKLIKFLTGTIIVLVIDFVAIGSLFIFRPCPFDNFSGNFSDLIVGGPPPVQERIISWYFVNFCLVDGHLKPYEYKK